MLPRVVFHHVPKCAGTTLLKFLEGTAPPERAAFLEVLASSPDPRGADRLAALLRAEFIHDPFGVHDWKALLGNVVEVIFLRDPVERLWSEWRMITRWDDALVADRGVPYRELRTVARAGFARFLALPGAGPFGNALACHLARGGELLERVRTAGRSGRPPSPDLLDALDARLAAIDCVGFVESFADSLLGLVARLGWPCPPAVQIHNVHAPTGELSSAERAAAEACTRLDRELVERARTRAAAAPHPGAEVLRERATEGSRSRLLDPPAALIVDMGEGLLGTGWHPCDAFGRRRVRWIGPDPVATVGLRIDRRRALALRLRVGNHLLPTQVEGLRILADGVPCAVDHWALPPFDHVYEAVIPAAPGAPPALHLAIDCGVTAAPPNSADPRRLGVEIEEIELAPADRLAPRSLAGLAEVRDELARLAATPDGDRRMQALLATLPAAG